MGDCETDTPSINNAFSIGLVLPTINYAGGATAIITGTFGTIINSNINVLELVNSTITLDGPGLYSLNYNITLSNGTIGDNIIINLLENGLISVNPTSLIVLPAANVNNVPGSIIYNNLISGTTIQLEVTSTNAVDIDVNNLTILKL